jgi:hypothetical protein
VHLDDLLENDGRSLRLRTIPTARDEYRGSFTKDQPPEPLSALGLLADGIFPGPRSAARVICGVGELIADSCFKDAAAINVRLRLLWIGIGADDFLIAACGRRTRIWKRRA